MQSSTKDRKRRPQQCLPQSLVDAFDDNWYLELAAITFSLICVIATAVILAHYDGKPSPKIAGLTLNAVIATLGTAAEASLALVLSNSVGQLKWMWFNDRSSRSLLDVATFDNASRGPYGALGLLFDKTRRSVASIGALMIIMALAFDPFIQLVIEYDTTTRFVGSSNQSAVMLRSGLFEVEPSSDNANVAINSAFWRDDFTWQPSECSTATCQWDDFVTLVWENSCYKDTNWTLSSACNLRVTSDFVYPGANYTETRNCSVHRSNVPGLKTSSVPLPIQFSYHTPTTSTSGSGNASVDLEPLLLLAPIVSAAITSDAANFWATSCNGTDPCSGTDVTSPLIALTTFNISILPDLTLGLEATSCELNLVANAYKIKSSGSGISKTLKTRQALRQVVQQTTILLNAEPWNQTWTCFQLEAPSRTPWFSDRVRELAGTNQTYLYGPDTAIITLENPSNDTQYCVIVGVDSPTAQWAQVLAKMEGLKNGSTSLITKNGPGITHPTNSTNVIRDLYHYNSSVLSSLIGGYYVSSSDYFDVLVRQGPEWLMNNVAASLTKLALDPASNPNGTDAIAGQIGEAVSLVRVRWLWLILPYGLCVAGALFLLLTVYLNRQAGAPLWKSSVNALFYHGIDDNYGTYEQLSTVAEMNTQAARTRAQLRPSGVYRKLMLETIVERRQVNQDDQDGNDEHETSTLHK